MLAIHIIVPIKLKCTKFLKKLNFISRTETYRETLPNLTPNTEKPDYTSQKTKTKKNTSPKSL